MFKRKKELIQMLSLSTSAIDRLEASGNFPRRRKLVSGGRTVVWLTEEIEDWVQGLKTPEDETINHG